MQLPEPQTADRMPYLALGTPTGVPGSTRTVLTSSPAIHPAGITKISDTIIIHIK